MSTPSYLPKPTHDQIANLAYTLWQIDGYVHGKDRQHWLYAEELLTRTETLPEAVMTNFSSFLTGEGSVSEVAEIRRRLANFDSEANDDLGSDSHQRAADHGTERDECGVASRTEG